MYVRLDDSSKGAGAADASGEGLVVCAPLQSFEEVMPAPCRLRLEVGGK